MNRNLPSHSVAVLLVLAGAAVSVAQPSDTVPPQDLLHYVQEARRSGVKEDKIKQQAVTIGWPSGTVDQAMAYARAGKPSNPVSADRDAGAPAKNPPPSVAPPTAETSETPTVNPTAATIPGITPPRLDASQDYQIAPGDTLQISVWKEPEVSVPSEIVRPDGKISVPLIRDIGVAGLTTKEVETQVTEQLTKFYTDAKVTVVVAAIAPKKIYVTGGVKKEGSIPFTNGMRVMQAISEAGGLTDYARRKKIYVLHTENGREYRLDVNYDEVLKGIRLEQNVLLAAGDTVVIPTP